MSNESVNLGGKSVSTTEVVHKPILGNTGDGLAILRGFNGNILEARSIVGTGGIVAVLDDAESQIELSLDAAKIRELAGTEDVYKDLLSLDQDLQSALTEINSVAVAGDILADKLQANLEGQITALQNESRNDRDLAAERINEQSYEIRSLRIRLEHAHQRLDCIDVALEGTITTADRAHVALRKSAAHMKRTLMVANISLVISAAILAERIWSLVP